MGERECANVLGGPYEIFAGRDASRGLAKQSFEEDMLVPVEGEIDPLEDLTKSEWENLTGWESEYNFYLDLRRRGRACRN